MIERTASELLETMAQGMTAESVAQAFLDAIAQRDGRIRAFLHVDREAALAQARAVDAKRRRREPLGPLAGVPIAVKDVLCTAGTRILVLKSPGPNEKGVLALDYFFVFPLFARMFDVREIASFGTDAEFTDQAVAAYVAKYATKSADASGMVFRWM